MKDSPTAAGSPSNMARHSLHANGAHATAAQAWKLMVEFFQGQRRHFERASAEFDLTKQQAHVLHVLAKEGPHSSRQLAQILGCDASNVTGLIDRLEARNLVTRKNVPGDRRMRMLAVTPAGAKLHRRIVASMAEAPPAIAVLEPSEQRALRDLMARALQHARNTESGETSVRGSQYPYHPNPHKA
jgi:MarR family transcriptional regulator, organic hydroperoxide resistance regulator